MLHFPKNELAQLLIATCANNKIEHVVISPGSRNAPLTIGFSNHPVIQTYSVVDERCAAFFALGMAQQLQKPVAIVCTSGSAMLNYYPAIAEAFYSNIPLVVISADRPKHLIDIGDGQTIRQENVFVNHILSSLNLEETYEQPATIISKLETILRIAAVEKGPVHINIPFNEPLYETVSELITIEKTVVTPKEFVIDTTEIETYAKIWNTSKRKLILVGECFPNAKLQQQLAHFTNDPSVLILIENTANVSHLKFINSIDKLIFPLEDEELEKFQPEIVLSLGGFIVSKKIKQHLRKFQPKNHWHVDEKRAYDTFHCLNHHFKVSATTFFDSFIKKVVIVDSTYQQFWLQKKMLRLQKHSEFLQNCAYSDLKVFDTLLKSIPSNTMLQLSNSAVIRYSQLFDIDKSISVFCNRGTSGIDGSTSTAIGASTTMETQTVFITGDISFFYDSNALWNSYIPKNFRIILVNNGGGGIFRFIPGPQNSDALDYFETPHQLTAEHLCTMFNFGYQKVSSIENIKNCLTQFFEENEQPKLLEIFTPREDNDKILKAYFNNLKD